MKIRGIPLIEPLVRRTLAGTKTETRRVCVPQPKTKAEVKAAIEKGSPYGGPGDLLYIRETHRVTLVRRRNSANVYKVHYRATDSHITARISTSSTKQIEQAERAAAHGKWRPPMFCARWAARCLLQVEAVSLVPLDPISLDEVIAEGLAHDIHTDEPISKLKLVEYFADGWDNINGARGYTWKSNPWVWRVQYERYEIKETKPCKKAS